MFKTQNFDHKNCKFTRASINYDMKSVQMWLEMKNESDKKVFVFCFVLFCFYIRYLNDNQFMRLSSKTFAGLSSLEKL